MKIDDYGWLLAIRGWQIKKNVMDYEIKEFGYSQSLWLYRHRHIVLELDMLTRRSNYCVIHDYPYYGYNPVGQALVKIDFLGLTLKEAISEICAELQEQHPDAIKKFRELVK